jgi:hypothetical protein
MALTRESSRDSGAAGLALGVMPSGTLALGRRPTPTSTAPLRGSRLPLPGRRARAPAGAVDTPLPRAAFWRDLGALRHAALRDAGVSRKRLPSVARGRDQAPPRARRRWWGRVPGHRRARGVLGGDERRVPRRAGRVRRAARGVPARAASSLARGGTRALPAENCADPAAPSRSSRPTARATRQGKAQHRPSARRSGIRGRGHRDKLWPCSSPCRSRRRSSCCASWRIWRRVSAARPDTRRSVSVPPRHPGLRGLGCGGAGAGGGPQRPPRRVAGRLRRAHRAGSAPTLLDSTSGDARRPTLTAARSPASPRPRRSRADRGGGAGRGTAQQALAHWKRVEAAAGEDGLSFTRACALSGAAVGRAPRPPRLMPRRGQR